MLCKRWSDECINGCMSEVLTNAGAGATSTKDSVKAALGQKAVLITSPPTAALGSEEERVKFWARPKLESPTVQQRFWHAWEAVQSPTGKASYP